MTAFVPTLGRAILSPILTTFRVPVAVSPSNASRFFGCSVQGTRAHFSTRVSDLKPIAMQVVEGDIDDDSDIGMDMENRREPSNSRSAPSDFEDTKLFIGNLSWSTTDQSLENAFSAYGEVIDSKVVVDRYTGKSRGFGFITFAESDSALAALQNMNGAEVDGRPVRIDRANKRVAPGPNSRPRRDMY